MANLSIADRTRIWRGLMRYWSAQSEGCSFTKFDLYNPTNNTGAVANVDTWVDTHSGTTAPDTVGMNGALTVAMRAALTAAQKGLLLVAVVAMRTGNVSILRAALGQEVD